MCENWSIMYSGLIARLCVFRCYIHVLQSSFLCTCTMYCTCTLYSVKFLTIHFIYDIFSIPLYTIQVSLMSKPHLSHAGLRMLSLILLQSHWDEQLLYSCGYCLLRLTPLLNQTGDNHQRGVPVHVYHVQGQSQGGGILVIPYVIHLPTL